MSTSSQMDAIPNGASSTDSAHPRELDAQALERSMHQTLGAWNGREPLWVFAYGSLVWQPELHFDARVPARVHGYHRRLCLRSIRYRGTPEAPGLVAGLDRGGSCLGVAYRIPANVVVDQFRALWRREMFMGSYDPRWVRCSRFDSSTAAEASNGNGADGAGERMRALAFVIRRDVPNYCGRMAEADVISVLLRARGVRGSSLDYVERTLEALHREGLSDPHLEHIVLLARRALAHPAAAAHAAPADSGAPAAAAVPSAPATQASHGGTADGGAGSAPAGTSPKTP